MWLQHNSSLCSVPMFLSVIFLLVLLTSDPAIGWTRAGCNKDEEWTAPEGSVVSLVKKDNRREIVSTEYGQISAVNIDDPVAKRLGKSSMKYHLQFISLDPNSLFLPVLLHADMVFYVHTGRGKLCYAEEDGKDTNEVKLKRGDVFRLKSGSIFYIRSSLEPERERLRINAMFSNNVDEQGPIQEQWVGPYSRIQDLVQGFDKKILEAAFQAPEEVIEEITNSTRTPPIAHAAGSSSKEKDNDDDDDHNTLWAKEATLNYMKRAVLFDFEAADDTNKKKKVVSKTKSTDTFNFFKEDPDVKNCNGWSTMVTQKNLRSLEGSHIGVFMVNLTAGSMMGPHWNPTAVEVGVVLEGSGMVMAVCSSGGTTECNNTRVLVKEGDVFAVPRFHPMAQLSFNNGTLVFMGFSTSNKYNHPQFLAGKASVLQVLKKAEAVLEAAFNVNKTTIGRLLDAQEELTILECLSCAEIEERTMVEEIEESQRVEEERKRREEARRKEEQRRREEEERRRKEEQRRREEEEQRRKEEEQRRREDEERKRKEEEQRRREKEEQKKKEEEQRKREEEEQRRKEEGEEEEEQRREQEEEEEQRQEKERQEERRRQKEKTRRQEEEQRWRQEEQARRQQKEEERRRQEEEEEDERRQEEEQRRRQEEAERRQQEEEQRRRQVEEQRRQEEARRQEKAARRKEEERRRQEEEEQTRQQQEERRQKEEEQRRRRHEEKRRQEEEQREREPREEETEEEIARREEEERQREWEEGTRRERKSWGRRPSHEETEEEEEEEWGEPTTKQRRARARRTPPYEEREEEFPPTRGEEESEEEAARREEEERQKGWEWGPPLADQVKLANT